MAEEQNAEQGMASDIQSQKSKRPRIIIILVGIAVLLVAIIVMFLIANAVVSLRSQNVNTTQQETWAPSTEGKLPPLSTFTIPPLQINLANPAGTSPAFVQVTIALAYNDPGAANSSGGGESKSKVVSVLADELDKRNFEIRDKIISIISSKSSEDLDSVDKQLLLKKEIINQINSILIHGIIQDVYISQFNIVKTNY